MLPLVLVLHLLPAQLQRPLGFLGFTPGMPLSRATALLTQARGRLTCRKSTDPGIAECTGSLPYPGMERPLGVLISSIRDSAAVIVFSGTPRDEVTRSWVADLTGSLGEPRRILRQPGAQDIREWIKRGRMLRLVQRNPGSGRETSVTLTHGPLLDGLGPPKIKAPD